jgi:hypothetical protein
MIGLTEVSLADFVAAWGGLHCAEPGRLRLDLAAAGVYAWEMPGPMAGGVHGVLSRQMFAAPLVLLRGVEGLVLFGAADAVPTVEQQAVIDRGGVRRWDSGLWLLPDPDTEHWYSRPHEGVSLGPVPEVVAAIGLATPIGVRRREAGR